MSGQEEAPSPAAGATYILLHGADDAGAEDMMTPQHDDRGYDDEEGDEEEDDNDEVHLRSISGFGPFILGFVACV